MKVKKGQILQHKGELNHKFYMVESDLLRSYTIDEKGKEHIFMFAPEDWIVGDGAELDQVGNLFIDALEDSVVIQMDKKSHVDHAVDKLLRRILVLQNRVIMLMSASAIERYEEFVKTYPDIVQRVPQKMIASYLGITPEALSYAKKQRLKKK